MKHIVIVTTLIIIMTLSGLSCRRYIITTHTPPENLGVPASWDGLSAPWSAYIVINREMLHLETSGYQPELDMDVEDHAL